MMSTHPSLKNVYIYEKVFYKHINVTGFVKQNKLPELYILLYVLFT